MLGWNCFKYVIVRYYKFYLGFGGEVGVHWNGDGGGRGSTSVKSLIVEGEGGDGGGGSNKVPSSLRFIFESQCIKLS